jgi:hypothetical protein
MYFMGLLKENIRAKYSRVNKMVKLHSNLYSRFLYLRFTLSTLSSITTTTLMSMAHSRMISNNLPAGVWVPKITSYILALIFFGFFTIGYTVAIIKRWCTRTHMYSITEWKSKLKYGCISLF